MVRHELRLNTDIATAGTFLTGRNPVYNVVYATGRPVVIALIEWHAWKWPRMELCERERR